MNMGITCIISSLADGGKAVVDTVAHASQAVVNNAAHAPETLAKYIDYNPDQGMPGVSYVLSSFDKPDWSIYGSMTAYSILFGILVVLAFVGLRSLTKRYISNNGRDRILKYGFFFAWLYGFVVYDVGMCTGQYISLLTNAPMAIIYAFKIFLFDSDVSEIHEIFHKSWFYSLNFALAHFFAAVISTLFLIKYFGFNIVASFRMWLATKRKKKRETYVFWGFNEATVHLVESIKKELGKSSDYRIIIVRTGKDDNEAPSERTGFARIFDFLAMPTSELERLQNLGCLTASSYSYMADVNVLSGETDILGAKLKLRKLKKIIGKRSCGKLHLFFLSDDEKDNLHNVSVLLHDITINEYADYQGDGNGTPSPADGKREVLFYCLARYNSVHRVIEDQNASDSIKVKVVDSSHINVEMLKQNPKLLPVNFVNVEADGTVTSPFNALVVGFSEVGQDSVQFLYEFGAFVKHGSDDVHVERSEFHMDVVDKNMADLAGTFVANAPAINPSLPFIEGKENPKALIALHQMDCRSVEFYLKLEDWIKTLNYVVIATENDELNLSLGVRIFKLATRYRANLKNFCILVRAHDDEDGHIRQIAEHYNRLWAAQMAVVGTEGKDFKQSEVRVGEKVFGPIHIFGLDKDIFTYDNIIDNSLEQKAILYKEQYEASSNPKYTEPEEERDMAWHKEFRERMQIPHEKGAKREFYPSLCGLQSLRRMQGQDMANSLHTEAKKLLAQKALEKAGIPDFDWTPLTRKFKAVEYELPSGADLNPQIERILNVLAQTEHLRWNASHEILGYICYGKPDYRHEIKLHHACITDWDKLSVTTRSYDYNVVDVALGIINPEDPIQQNETNE